MPSRRSIVLLLVLLLGAGVAMMRARSADAEVVQAFGPIRPGAIVHKTTLRTTSALDPDTVYIGHVFGSTGLPGVAGGYGPWHIGRGGNRPGTGSASGNNGYWDFDRLNPGETDTLQGWWSLQTPFQSVGGSNVSDFRRPMFCFDYGNSGNYRGNDTQKTTFGVLGYWHRDSGTALTSTIAGTNPVAPGWSALDGSYSAWCGLRAHGDLTAVDPITGNAFNIEVISREGDNHNVQFGSSAGIANLTDANFPGYGSQWDQMMYRDFPHTTGQSMVVSFEYSTRMSNGVNTASNTRTGWFDKDPLKSTNYLSYLPDGNFISSSLAGTHAPIDSFMVYVGVATDPAACVYTDGVTRPIWDTQRRWFSEVLRIDQPYYELLSTWGVTAATQNPTWTIPASVLDALGSTVRLVFRVKTNRGSDDEDTYVTAFSSGGRGAAIVDDISVQDGANPAVVTGFESATDIDNTIVTPSTDAWKTTGKPPGVYFHWHNLQAGGSGGYSSGLPYADPCGAIGAPHRLCNMSGNVITPGNHDLVGERPAGQFGANDEDREDWFMSPTINLMSSGNGPGFYNDMGIDQEIAARTAQSINSIHLNGEVYVNLLQFGSTGNGMRTGFQTYPGIQAGNHCKSWAAPVKTIALTAFDGTFGCQPSLYPIGVTTADLDPTYLTTNANGVADSVRALVEHLSICYRISIGIICSPTTGPNVGMYLDNLSLELIRAPLTAPAISGLPWDLWQDAFPTNSNDSFVGSPAFDTLAAQLRTGWNSSSNTNSLTRNNIPGDTMIVKAPGANVRVDLLFRILPGPGNYVSPPTGPQKMGQVKKRPDQAAAATAGDGSFWGSYLADVGLFGTSGPHTSATTMSAAGGYGVPADQWDPNIWVSARCDTAELNLFPCTAVGNVNNLFFGSYTTTYHEDEIDPTLTRSAGPVYGGARVGLGIEKPRCILISTVTGDPTDETNIDCGAGTVPPSGTSYAAAWATKYVPAIGGYTDPTCPACPVGHTKEYTKIIPDGQLTAGSHVEYFFRKTFVGNLIDFVLYPDTTLIVPNTDASYDGHRWAQMSVLPDRWKDPNFGGDGMACMLVDNGAARRGDMPVFDQIAQTIGLTSAAKRGAGNGYFVGATQAFPGAVTDLLPGQQVSLHLGQNGTLFDVYDVLAVDSNEPAGRLGSRYAAPGAGLATGKGATAGPTKSMLRTYYRHLFVLGADVSSQPWGPLLDQTDDDIGVLTDFMTNATGSASPRTVIVTGKDMASAENTDHPGFIDQYFGTKFRAEDYRSFASGNLTPPPSMDDVADLIPLAPLSSSGAIYGVFNACTVYNDVLNVNAAVPGAAPAVYYENVSGPYGPYIAGVYAPAGGSRLANTLWCGWTLGLFGGQGSRYRLSPGGTEIFWLNALTGLIGDVCGQPLSAPSGVGDQPGVKGAPFVDFLNLRSQNPMRSGDAVIAFGITKTEKVEVRIYDVTGRLVRTLANRVFPAGEEHLLTWDGTNQAGQRVARGVYFYQLRSPSFVSEKKLTLLKN